MFCILNGYEEISALVWHDLMSSESHIGSQTTEDVDHLYH